MSSIRLSFYETYNSLMRHLRQEPFRRVPKEKDWKSLYNNNILHCYSDTVIIFVINQIHCHTLAI